MINDLIKIRSHGISSVKRIKILKTPSINPFNIFQHLMKPLAIVLMMFVCFIIFAVPRIRSCLSSFPFYRLFVSA